MKDTIKGEIKAMRTDSNFIEPIFDFFIKSQMFNIDEKVRPSQ